jgi:hypothetical protein
MAQPSAKAPMKETNNHPQGRTGSATPQKKGPAAPGGSLKSNKTSGGGINRPTKGSVPSY